MNRKVIKVLTIVWMLMMSFTLVANPVFAADNADTTKGGVTLDIGTDLVEGTEADSAITTPAQKVIATAIKTIQIVGMGIAIIMLVMIAIKYMTAAPSDKADFKKSATAYIVGAVVLFAATGILQIVKNFATTSIQANVA